MDGVHVIRIIGASIAFIVVMNIIERWGFSGLLVVAVIGLGIAILYGVGAFDSSAERIRLLKDKARLKGYYRTISTVIDHLGRDGHYEDPDFNIKEQKTESDFSEETNREIIYGGSTVYSDQERRNTHSTDSYGRRYKLAFDDSDYKFTVIGYIPGAWEHAYQSLASRADQLREQSLSEWGRKRKDDEKKRFGL